MLKDLLRAAIVGGAAIVGYAFSPISGNARYAVGIGAAAIADRFADDLVDAISGAAGGAVSGPKPASEAAKKEGEAKK